MIIYTLALKTKNYRLMKTKLQKSAFLMAFTLIVFSANATLLLKENFQYTAGVTLETQPTWDWMEFHYSLGTGSTQGAFPILVESGALSYPGYPDSGVGNKVKLEAMPGEDLYRIFPRIDAPSATNPTSTAYASFLVNVSAATTAGDWFFHLSSNPILKSIFHGRVAVKKNASDKLAFGIYRVQGGKLVWTDFIYNLNTSYLIVLKYNFVSVGVQNPTGDDVCSIIINPAIESNEPATGWLVATGETGAEANNMVGAVCVRQSTNGPTATISNIRVADNWSDLMDNTKVPSGIQLATDDAIKTGFEATTSAPSAAQTFKVSATGLTDELQITQDFPTPILYELSLDGTNYVDTLKIPATASEIAQKTIYLRYKSQLTTSLAQTKIIVLSSVGKNKTYISCNGLVKSPTAITDLHSKSDITVVDGKIRISNINRGESVQIFNQTGQKIYDAIAVNETHLCAINAKGVLIVRAGNKFQKLIFN